MGLRCDDLIQLLALGRLLMSWTAAFANDCSPAPRRAPILAAGRVKS